jgi:hypothetical protein
VINIIFCRVSSLLPLYWTTPINFWIFMKLDISWNLSPPQQHTS